MQQCNKDGDETKFIETKINEASINGINASELLKTIP